MRSGKFRVLAWFFVLLLVLSPLLAAGPIASVAAQDAGAPAEEGTPSDPVGDATETPVVGVPSETPTETATEVLVDTPTETATTVIEDPASPTEVPATEDPATDVPTEQPTGTPTPTKEATVAEDDGPISAAVVAPSEISVTISCRTDPETIRVTNNGAASIQITALTSLFDQTAAEPFPVSRTLLPGKTAIYQAGRNAQYGTVLTTSYLFTNSAYEQDGIKVVTSVGNAYQRCAPRPATPTATPVLVTPDQLKVTLNCLSTAETIRVTNNGAGPVLIKGLATMYDPIAEEPFAVSRNLQPGHTAIFQAGADAQYGTVLTKSYIFTNSAYDQDGIRINTSAGRLYKRCAPKPQPVGEKWIAVNLSAQWATAYVGSTPVNSTIVSTGKPGWETPTGTHYIKWKYRYDTMAGNEGGETWYVPDVPFVNYFTDYGHAFHGKYWNNLYGTPMSHGCVNLPMGFAEWFYYWAPIGMRIYVHY